MADGKWFETGHDDLDQVEKEYAVRKARRARRFWMKMGEKKLISFLTGSPVKVWEHEIVFGDDWKNKQTRTCRASLESCYACGKGNEPKNTGYYLVVDHTGYTDKKGVTHKDLVRLYPAGLRTMKSIKEIEAALGKPVTGMTFSVNRLTETSARCGENFTKVGELTAQQLKEFMENAPDLMDVLAPVTNDELKLLFEGGGGTVDPEVNY